METTEVKAMNVERTTRKGAQGGYCPTCNQLFNVTTVPFWHWSKSVAMHRRGTGHDVEFYRIGR